MRQMDDLRREYTKQKRYKFEEMWECEWWGSIKTNEKIEKKYRTHVFHFFSFSTISTLAKIKDGYLIGFVQ